eukprot:EG_transcript_15650
MARDPGAKVYLDDVLLAKTHKKPGDAAVVWYENFTLRLDHPGALRFVVISHHRLHPNDALGSATVDLGALRRGQRLWQGLPLQGAPGTLAVTVVAAEGFPPDPRKVAVPATMPMALLAALPANQQHGAVEAEVAA